MLPTAIRSPIAVPNAIPQLGISRHPSLNFQTIRLHQRFLSAYRTPQQLNGRIPLRPNQFRHALPITTPKRGFGVSVLALSSAGAAITAATGLVAFFVSRYRVSLADQYLVRTGLGIKDIAISKHGLQWPFQTYSYIDLQPINLEFALPAMTSEKMEFLLPGVFTIGPRDDPESLKKYALKMINVDRNSEQIMSLVKGILEGEVRILSAQMTMEEIFSDRKAFKEKIVQEVQAELDEFGMKIYNANIKELQDTPGSEYFSYIRQKKRSEAENKAKIDVAEARKAGDIGQKEREMATRQQVAMFEAEAVKQENTRRSEIERSHANLEVIKAEAFQTMEMARIQATAATKLREAHLQAEVEQRKISTETEKLRANDMSKAQVKAEVMMKNAEGAAIALRTQADAEKYSAEKKAEAERFAMERLAEAQLFTKLKEAEGILAVFNAQSEGLQKLLGSLGSNQHMLIQYLMIEKGVYEKLSQSNADAIRGLQPKITVWNTSNAGKDDDGTKAISNVMTMLPPLLNTIHDQTGIKPPGWIANMPENPSSSQKEQNPAKIV